MLGCLGRTLGCNGGKARSRVPSSPRARFVRLMGSLPGGRASAPRLRQLFLALLVSHCLRPCPPHEGPLRASSGHSRCRTSTLPSGRILRVLPGARRLAQQGNITGILTKRNVWTGCQMSSEFSDPQGDEWPPSIRHRLGRLFRLSPGQRNTKTQLPLDVTLHISHLVVICLFHDHEDGRLPHPGIAEESDRVPKTVTRLQQGSCDESELQNDLNCFEFLAAAELSKMQVQSRCC